MGQRWGRTRGMGGVWLMWVESKGVEPKRGGVKRGRSQKEAESKLGGAKRRRSQNGVEPKRGGVKRGQSQTGWSPSLNFFFFNLLSLSFIIPVNKMNLKSLPPSKSHNLEVQGTVPIYINNFKKFICPLLSITFLKMRFPPVYSYCITNFELGLYVIHLFFVF